MKLIELLQARARLINELREFFEKQQVLEVDTPLLYPSATTDPYINHLSISLPGEKRFLQSSPEFAMKRLLAEAPVSIYQICKAFRAGETGSRHNIEFTMLEWYMLDYSLEQLMEQCENLLSSILNVRHFHKITYRKAFLEKLDFDPFTVELNDLHEIVSKETSALKIESFSKDECLHLLFAEQIEKSFDKQVLTFVYDFPESQAALAQTTFDELGNIVAKRFEIYHSGVELANAYQEENNAEILLRRFNRENSLRQKLGKEEIPIDKSFLKAMEKFPACSGIAMGVDRLLLLKLNKTKLKEINFFHQDMKQ